MKHKQKTFRLDGHRYEMSPLIPQDLLAVYVSPLSAEATDAHIHAAVDRAIAATHAPWAEDEKLRALAYAFAKAHHRKAHGLPVTRTETETHDH